MKIKTFTLGAMMMACSAVAMAQSQTGGDAAGQGSGLTRTQANSVTMNNAGAMGNASGQADSQGVGNMSSSNDAVSPVSTDTATNSPSYPAVAPGGYAPTSDYPATTAPTYPTSAHSTGMANSGPSVPASRTLNQFGQ